MSLAPKHDGTQIERLFKGKQGTVHFEVYGFRIPFRVTGIQFYRLRMSATRPGKFDRVDFLRENDLAHHEKAIKSVRKWISERR